MRRERRGEASVKRAQQHAARTLLCCCGAAAACTFTLGGRRAHQMVQIARCRPPRCLRCAPAARRGPLRRSAGRLRMAPPARARARGQLAVEDEAKVRLAPSHAAPRAHGCGRGLPAAACRAAAAPQQKRRRCAHERVLRQRISQRRQQSAAPPCRLAAVPCILRGVLRQRLVSSCLAASLPLCSCQLQPLMRRPSGREEGACASNSCHLERRPIVGKAAKASRGRRASKERRTRRRSSLAGRQRPLRRASRPLR